MKAIRRKPVRYASKSVSLADTAPVTTQELRFGELLRHVARRSVATYFAPLRIFRASASRPSHDIIKAYASAKKKNSTSL